MTREYNKLDQDIQERWKLRDSVLDYTYNNAENYKRWRDHYLDCTDELPWSEKHIELIKAYNDVGNGFNYAPDVIPFALYDKEHVARVAALGAVISRDLKEAVRPDVLHKCADLIDDNEIDRRINHKAQYDEEELF